MDDVVTDPVSGDENAAVFGGDIPKHTGGERCLNLNKLYNMKQIKTLGVNHQLTVKDIKTGKDFLINKEDAFAEIQVAMDDLAASIPVSSTTTVVNISSAEILGMGTAPVVLLPAPGVEMYYDIEKIIFEYTHVTIQYTFLAAYPSFIIGTTDSNYYGTWLASYTICAPASMYAVLPFPTQNPNNTPALLEGELTNQAIYISTDTAEDPTAGNGTLRIIITYTIRTFGA